jgi:hypothetical protein
MFHRRCYETETTLRAIIEDLRAQLADSRKREDDLYGRALAVNQPHAYNATKPVAPLPAGLVPGRPGGLQAFPARRTTPLVSRPPARAATTSPAPAGLQEQVLSSDALDPAASS